MQKKLLRPADVCEMASCSRSTLHRLSKRPDFPQKIELSRRHVGWWESEIYAFFNSLKGGI